MSRQIKREKREEKKVKRLVNKIAVEKLNSINS